MSDIEPLLQRLREGDAGACEALFAAAYDDLRQLAHARLREGGRATLMDTGVLVHETYLRLTARGALPIEHRRAFFGYASKVMRSVIVDAARERLAQRRGAGAERVTLDTALGERLALPADEQLLQVHEAVTALAAAEPRLAQVVEMRFFGGYGEAEIAEALGLAERTVRRDWDKAQRLLAAWLGA